MIIYSILGCCGYFGIGIGNQIRSIKYSLKFEIEKFKFTRQLDKEDRLFEQQLQQGTATD